MTVQRVTTSNGFRPHRWDLGPECWCQPRVDDDVILHRDVVCGRYVGPTMSLFSDAPV